MRNFSSILRWHAERTPEKIAIRFEGKEIPYEELDLTTSSFASSIKAHGGRPNEIVAILLYNTPEFYYAAIGANKAGLAFLPLNYRLAREEIKYILSNSQAKFLVTQSQFKDQVDQIRNELPDLSTCLIVDGPSDEGWINFNSFVSRSGERISHVDYEPNPEDMHRLMYTSGTTANPKGVVVTYSNMWWKTFAHSLELESNKNDVALVAGPLYHVGAFDLAAAHVLYAGGSLVILRRFEPKDCLEAIEKYKVTVTWLAPSMLNMILHQEDLSSYNLTSMRLIIDGGEKMPEPLINKLLSAFPNTWYADAYGLTETVSGDTFVPKEYRKKKLGSVGRPTPFVELRVVDENGNELPAVTDGEIVIRGPKVFNGYWKDEAATRSAIREGGWFHTGDIGHIDEDGFLYITDRKKDMIKSGGENVSSLEIERVLYQHPDVKEVAVVGMKDDTWGEVPVAFVVPKQAADLSDKVLLDFCTNKLARFKMPKKFFIQEEPLPRNPSGKVLKRVLRDRVILHPRETKVRTDSTASYD